MKSWFLTGRKRLVWLGVVGLGLLLAGCGGQKSGDGPAEGELNLQRLMRLANKHRTVNRGQLPANEEAFKKFAKGLKAEELKDMDITDVDKTFISPRDNQPYTINYKVEANPPSTSSKNQDKKSVTKAPVFAYEQKGSGGKRYLALAQGGSVLLVTEEEFKGYVPD